MNSISRSLDLPVKVRFCHALLGVLRDDEARDRRDGAEVLGGELLVGSLHTEARLEKRDDLEDARRVDEPTLHELLIGHWRGRGITE